MDYQSAEKMILQQLREQLPPTYFFHNWEHTADVVAAVARLASECGCSERETVLLKTAALCHDTGYLRRYERNEALGVEFARRYLPQFGYGEPELTEIETLILSTEFPYHPQRLLEKVLCDADLFYILTDCFAERANRFRRELAGRQMPLDDVAWQELETKFLCKITYYTDYCRNLYRQLKPLRLAALEKICRSTQP